MAEHNRIRNPALKDLEFLAGSWRVKVSNASFLPKNQTVSSWDSVEWLENSYLVWVGKRRGDFPRAVRVIGRNENEQPGIFSMLYSDDRGVSRIYKMTLKGNVWTIWREDADFHQRFVGKIGNDKTSIKGYWENSNKDNIWEHDFDVEYTKIKPEGKS